MNTRDPNSGKGNGGSLAAYPVATSFAMVVLVALLLLVLLRHLFGSVRVEVGAR